MHASRRILRPYRLNPTLCERSEQVSHQYFTPANEARRETSPEHPTRTFQNTLPTHIGIPSIRAVVLVAVALDGKSIVIVTLDHEVDAIFPNLYLWRNPITALSKDVVNLALKRRLAEFT